MKKIKWLFIAIVKVVVLLCIAGCGFITDSQKETITITDQLGRKVKIPKNVERISALHHFGGKIVYALKKQNLLVEKSIYGREAAALNRIDPAFASLPSLIQSHGYNVEGLVSLNPEIIFLYSSNDRTEMEQFKNAGIPVVAVKGETFKESFEAIRLISRALNCQKKGDEYIKTCQDLLSMVKERLKDKVKVPLNVLFAGPKSVYSVATGSMLQSQILELSGARNVALELHGFWADVSPEQIAKWNPDVIFLGSYLDMYGKEKIYENSHFQTVKAIKNRRIYSFPSNIGWWDYPAPHCVLGVVWSAKTLYPQYFEDINMKALADDFYKKYVGYTFEGLGGKLD